MVKIWVWSLVSAVAALLYLTAHKLGYSADNKTVPVENAMANLVPVEHFLVLKDSTELESKLQGINENPLTPGNNHLTTERYQSDDDRAISRPENTHTQKKETFTTLTEKKIYMKQFVNILYSWDKYDTQFDAVLIAMGITNYYMRMAARTVTILERLLENEKNDGDWEYNLTVKVHYLCECKFKLGVPVKYMTMDGRKVQSIFTLVEKNVLIEDQTFLAKGENKKATLSREYSLDKMSLTITIDNITTVQSFVVK